MSARNAYRLFVKNLSWTTASRDLREYFSKFGSVKSGTAAYDKETGIPKGFGFVVFNNKEEFDNVLQMNHTLEGNRLVVAPAKEEE